MSAQTPRGVVEVGMILPTADPTTGEITSTARYVDERIPAGLGPDTNGPRVFASWLTTPRCPTGRHRWDAIEVTGPETWRQTDRDDRDGRTTQFRLTLTCIRCGNIQQLAGTYDSHRSRSAWLDPNPLRAGVLWAQQVHAAGHPGWDSWAVHDSPDGPTIGMITWGVTRRGRHYYAGRVAGWPAGKNVEAPTPIACLRKLARTLAATPAAGAS